MQAAPVARDISSYSFITSSVGRGADEARPPEPLIMRSTSLTLAYVGYSARMTLRMTAPRAAAMRAHPHRCDGTGASAIRLEKPRTRAVTVIAKIEEAAVSATSAAIAARRQPSPSIASGRSHQSQKSRARKSVHGLGAQSLVREAKDSTSGNHSEAYRMVVKVPVAATGS